MDETNLNLLTLSRWDYRLEAASISAKLNKQTRRII